jgi:hypothetical protein
MRNLRIGEDKDVSRIWVRKLWGGGWGGGGGRGCGKRGGGDMECRVGESAVRYRVEELESRIDGVRGVDLLVPQALTLTSPTSYQMTKTIHPNLIPHKTITLVFHPDLFLIPFDAAVLPPLSTELGVPPLPIRPPGSEVSDENPNELPGPYA